MTTLAQLTTNKSVQFKPLQHSFSEGHPTDIDLKGEWGFRLAKNIHRLEHELPYAQEYMLGQVWPDNHTWSHFPRFHGDVAGRWVLAMTWAHSAKTQAPQHVQDMVNGLIDLQNDDGSLGRVQTDEEPRNMHRAYGNAWCMKGLAAYAQVFQNERARIAACAIGDFFIHTFDLWNEKGNDVGVHSYAVSRSCYFHGLDGLIQVYQLTQESRYLDLAGKFIPLLTPMTAADHNHMYLTTRRGMLQYGRLTNDRTLIQSITEELEDYHNLFVLETGGVPERLCHCEKERNDPDRTFSDEACALFDWELLCWELFDITGDTRWQTRALINLENQIAFNQHTNGGFGDQHIGPHYGSESKEAPWCCSLFGPFALTSIASYFARRTHHHNVQLNHIADANYTFADDSSLSVRYNYDSSTLTLQAQGAIQRVTLANPFWINAETQILLDTNGYAECTLTFHTWASARLQPPQPLHWQHQTEGICFHGPWLMGHRFNNPQFPTAFVETDKNSFIKNAQTTSLTGLGFSGTGIRLCLPANTLIDTGDVSRGYDQHSGSLWMYRLCDREVVWRQWTRLTLQQNTPSVKGTIS